MWTGLLMLTTNNFPNEKLFEEEIDLDFEKCFEWRKRIERTSSSEEYTRQRARYFIRAKHNTNPRSEGFGCEEQLQTTYALEG